MPLLQLSSSPLLDFCEQCEKYHQLILVDGVLVQRSCENRIIESMAEEKILSETNMTTRMTNTDSLNSLSSISIRNHFMPTSFNEAKERVDPPESLATIMKGPYVSLNTGQKPLSSKKSVEGRSKPKVLGDGRGLPDRSVSPIRGTKCLYHGHEVSPVVVRTKPAVNNSSSKIQSPIKQPLKTSLSNPTQQKNPLSQSNSSFKPTPIILPPVSSSFPQPQLSLSPQPQPPCPRPTFTPTPIYLSPHPQPTETPHFGSQSIISQNKQHSTTASIRSRRDLLKREYLVPELQDEQSKPITLGNSKGKSNGKEEYCCFGYMRCD